MTEGQITPVTEEYLRAILDLGIAGRSVIGRRLADWLEVAPSTVTATLQRMGKEELVTLNERKEVSLAKKGAASAIAAARRPPPPPPLRAPADRFHALRLVARPPGARALAAFTDRGDREAALGGA